MLINDKAALKLLEYCKEILEEAESKMEKYADDDFHRVYNFGQIDAFNEILKVLKLINGDLC
jgi:hypothetical protein